MKHCPKCNAEYRDEAHQCSDCRVPLVFGPAEPPEKETIQEPYGQGEELAVLCTAANEPEAEIIVGLMRSSGIEAYARLRDLGIYMKSIMGNSNLGVDVVVKASDFEEARDILEALPQE